MRSTRLPAPIEEDLARGILDAIDMDSYRAEKKATLAIALPDADAEIEPVPTATGGRKPEPELDRLSNIVKAFNEQFGGLFADPQRMEQRITGEIPTRVSADQAYQNARQNSDRQNARIEHDKALKRVLTSLFADDAQLFKQFQDNESFRHWLTETVFGMTCDGSVASRWRHDRPAVAAKTDESAVPALARFVAVPRITRMTSHRGGNTRIAFQ